MPAKRRAELLVGHRRATRVAPGYGAWPAGRPARASRAPCGSTGRRSGRGRSRTATRPSPRASAGSIVAAMLDGEVGDAAPRVEHVGRDEGVRRAGVEAGPAGAAAVRQRRVVVELGRRQEHADEEPRAERRDGAASCSCRSSRAPRARRGRARAPGPCPRRPGCARPHASARMRPSRSSRGVITSW